MPASMTRGTRRPLRARRRAGLSLVEAVVSVVITAILMLAVGQALRFALISAGAAPSTGATNSVSQGLASDVADQIAADLNVALDFTEKTATAVTFTVPDRDNDGNPEKIRYAWSGASGSPGKTPPIPAYTLTRELNDGTWVALASDVRTCNFKLLYRSMSPPAALPAESLLLSYGISDFTGQSDYWVTSAASVAEAFNPPVSLGASSWSITRIKMQLKCDATYDGIIKVQVRTADALLLPTSTVLEEVLVPEEAFADQYQAIEIPFTKLTNLSTSQPLAIVISGSAGTTNLAGVAWSGALLGIPLGTGYTTNSGGGWGLSNPLASLRYAVYGRVTP